MADPRRDDQWASAGILARRLYERGLDSCLYPLPGWPSVGALFDAALDLVGQRNDRLAVRAQPSFPECMRFRMSPWRSVQRRAEELGHPKASARG